MFEFLIGVSVVLFVLGVLCYRAPPAVFAGLVGCYAALSGLIVLLFVPWLLLTYAGMFAAWGACRWLGWSRWRFSAVSLLAIAGAWGVAVWQYMPQWQEVQMLAREYPITRIDQRLAYEINTDRGFVTAPSEEMLTEASRLSADLSDQIRENSFYGNERELSLSLLEHTHNNFESAFANQNGFGYFRMPVRVIKRENIELPDVVDTKLPPPPPVSVSAMSEDQAEWTPPQDITETTRHWHAKRVAKFSNPLGFGYIVGSSGWNNWSDETDVGKVQSVRGFEPHAFQAIADDSPLGKQWQLARLELVSLLKHDPAAVYESETLPRMEELSSEDFPTRELDTFESVALKRLYKGEVIVVRQGRNRVRMLGALLATNECIRCHNVSQGEMLGAFTYEFLRKEPLPPKKEPQQAEPPLT